MSCTIQNKVVIANDKDGKIEKALAEIINDDDRVLLSVRINNGLFQHWFEENRKRYGEAGTKYSSIYDMDVNALKRFIKEYYNYINPTVEKQEVKNHTETAGDFLSFAAKKEARSHTGNLILDLHYKNLEASPENRVSKEEIFKQVKRIIRDELIKRGRLDASKEELAKIDELKNKYDTLLKELEEAQETYKKAKTDDNKEIVKSKGHEKEVAWQEYISYIKDVIKTHKNIKNINYAALHTAITSNEKEWFKEVFELQKMLDVAKTFEKAVVETNQDWEALNAEDYTESDTAFAKDVEQEKDQMSKGWEDNIATSYLKYYNSRLTVYLSNLYKRSTNIVGQEDSDNSLMYSDNLGVPEKMDYRYIIDQITNMMNGASISKFIESLEEMATNIPSLYGLGKLVNDIKNDTVFGYFVFSQLRKPLIAKTMIRINRGIVEASYSNSEAFVKSTLVNNLLNNSNFTYKGAYIENDFGIPIKIKDILNKSIYKRGNKFATDSEVYFREDLGETLSDRDYILRLIQDYFGRHFPSISSEDLENIYYSNNNDAIQMAKNFAKVIEDYQKGIKSTLESYNTQLQEYKKKRKAWKSKLEYEASTGGNVDKVKEQEPVFDSNSINTASRNKAIIEIANLLNTSIPVKTKLNSSNAEGSMSSNLLKNSYITILMEKVKDHLNHGNEKDAIETLKDFLTKRRYSTSEYEYSTILFGITDSRGITVVPGMFIRNKNSISGQPTYKVNEEFFKGFNISLFDGNQNGEDGDGQKYVNMSPGDFLMAQMKAFSKPVRYDGQTQDDVTNFMNIFMRVPSDASNTYMIQIPRYKYSDLYNENVPEAVQKLNDEENKLLSYANVKEHEGYSFVKHTNELINSNSPTYYRKNNYLNDEDMTKLLVTGTVDYRINISKYVHYNNKDKVYIPFVAPGKKFVVWTVSELEPNGYFSNNLKIVSIVNTEKLSTNQVVNKAIEDYKINMSGESTVISNNTSKVNEKEFTSLNTERTIQDYFNTHKSAFLQKLYKDKVIPRVFDRKNQIFRGFVNNIISELNEFVNQLNTVTELNDKGELVTRTDTTDLFDLLHYKEGKIVENGKLTGNVFQFTKLFNSGDSDVNNEIIELFNIYGNSDSLLVPYGDGQLKVNSERNDLFITRNSKNGKELQFLYGGKLNQLEDIVAKWLSNYINDIYEYARDYQNIIENEMNNVNIEDFILNTTLAYMEFDDLFEGSSKFYKDAQTFLKRAKETQMGGTIFGAFDFSDDIGGELHNAKDSKGNDVVIDVPGLGKMNIKNGFKAITIKNTINKSPAQKLEDMWKTIHDGVLDKTGSETIATDVANEIARGYGRDYIGKDGKVIKGAKTKYNDAQSYITFEEFVRRKIADGTYEEYKDIIEILADPNADLSKIDWSKYQKFVQVQKNVYYDLMYDPNSGRHYPRQIKNAEFVLIPALLPKEYELDEQGNIKKDDNGKPIIKKISDLEVLYNIMKEYGIDQVNTAETSKAAQRNIVEYWDNNGIPDAEKLKSSLTGNVIENYYYANLYKQLDNHSHLVDTTNKAGIQIMKKILDNYSTLSKKSQDACNRIQDAYSANIKASFEQFIFNMGWEFEGDRIVNRLTDEQKQGLSQEDINKLKYKLNFTEYLKRARFEAQRLGLDKNVLEFLTPNEYGVLEMPIQLNNVSTKLEAIAQSLFNNRITRQTLPGWHAVQVTGIGYSDKLAYRPNGENIMQIMVAPWSKEIRDMIREKGKEYTLDYLKKNKLNRQILYCIPTEGKQSIIVGEIVDFVPEAYDSTLIVADEWITQTGKDFDVDSVYSIIPVTGANLRKIDTTLSEDNELEYIRYVRDYVNSASSDVLDLISNENEAYKEENDRLNNLKIRTKQQFAFGQIRSQIDSYILKKGANKFSEDLRLKVNNEINVLKKQGKSFEQICDIMPEKLNSILHLSDMKISDEDKAKMNRMIELYGALNSMADTIVAKDETGLNPYEVKTAEVKELRDNARRERLHLAEDIAIKLGIKTFDEFKNQDVYDKYSTAQRNNIIFEAMLDIMLSEDVNEEMLGRSNCDELTRSKQINEDLSGQTFASYSPYNPFNQLKFMQNAIDGRKLKAISVNRDNLNSINNKLHTKINNAIAPKVIYDESEYDKKFIGENYDVENSENGHFTVVHNKLSWSETNRNVKGRLILPYSSQTTAHILDAIKEGALINENEFTFGTFKTLLDVGIDTDTAVAWLMQPAITRIVNHYNANNSMFIGDSGNPVTQTLKDLAIELQLKDITKNSSDYQVIKAFLEDKRVQERYGYLLSKTITEKNKEGKEEYKIVPISFAEFEKVNFPIDRKVIKDRLGNYNSKNEIDLIDDFITVVQFDRIHKLSDMIEREGQVLRPEAAGAKQTIRATREIEDKVNKYRNSKDPINYYLYCEREVDEEVKDEYGNVHTEKVLKKIPVVSVIYTENINNSDYKYIDAFYKYVIQASVSINEQLFPTESAPFRAVVNDIIAGIGHDVSDAQYQTIKKSVVNYIQNNLQTLLVPTTLVTDNLFAIPDVEAAKQETGKPYWETEKGRIFGYESYEGYKAKIPTMDFINPSAEFIEEFKKYTPLQKVVFMQTHLQGDDRGIFGMIDTRSQIAREIANKGYSRNRLFFNDTITLADEVYDQFREAFYNKNPLIRLAAIDLIKYAFVVEGYNFKKGYITKMIPNDVIKNDTKNKGLDVIAEFNMYFDPSILYQSKNEITKSVIRSHPEFFTPVRIPYSSGKPEKPTRGDLFRELVDSNGFLYIPLTKKYTDLLNHLTKVGNSSRSYVVVDDYSGKTYRRILYKIISKQYVPGKFLVPIGFLDANEVSDQSINQANKPSYLLTEEYYDTLVNQYADEYVHIDFTPNEDITDQNDKDYSKFLHIDSTSERIKELRDKKKEYKLAKYDKNKALFKTGNPDILINELNTALQENNLPKAKVIQNFFDSLVNQLEESKEIGDEILLLNNNQYIKTILGLNSVGSDVTINVPYGDEIVPITITRYSSYYFDRRLSGKKLKPNENDAINEKYYKEWYEKGLLSTTFTPTVYRIKINEGQDIEELQDVDNTSDEEYSILDEIHDSIMPEEIDTETKEEKIDVASYIAHKIEIDAKRENDAEGLATETIKSFKYRNIYINDDKSIGAHRSSIYKIALDYYRNLAAKLTGEINEFKLYDGEKYSIDDPVLYQKILGHDSDFHKLLKLVLKASTLNESLNYLTTIGYQGEDSQTDKFIKDILQITNEVSSNPKIREAYNHIFNIYLTNEISTNPQIRAQILNITDNFGQISNITKWIADASELPHKQIQVVVKMMNQIISKAEIDGKKAVRDFQARLNSLLQWNTDEEKQKFLDSIFDDKGRLIRPYSDEFIEDMNKLQEDLETIGLEKGYNSKEYFLKSLELEKFRRKYTYQLLPDDFYDKKIQYQEEVYSKAGDLFLRYRELQNQIRDFDEIESLDDEQKEEYDKLNALLSQLLDEKNADNTEKTNDELEKIDAIKEYSQNMGILYKKYYIREKTEDWQRTLDYSLTIINTYNASHLDLSLDEKLENPEYRIAYEWLENNAIKLLNETTRFEINKAYDALNSYRNEDYESAYKTIRDKHKEDGSLYDAFGEIIGTNFTEDEQQQIVDDLNRRYNDGSLEIGNTYSDSSLIKDVKEDVILTKEFWEKRIVDKNETDDEVIQEKKRIITRINQIIGKGINRETGGIDFDTLYERCTNAELNELIGLYAQLRTIYSARKRNDAKTKADMLKSKVFYNKVNKVAFETQYSKYKTYNAEKQYFFKYIFCQANLDGTLVTTKKGDYVPNDLIYGYIELAKDKDGKYYHPEYIDVKKTKAKKLLDDNVEYVKTSYYDREIRRVQREANRLYEEAIAAGKDEKDAEEISRNYSDKWFYRNHYYNRYSHKFELIPIWTKLSIKKNGNLSGKYNYYPLRNENYIRKPKTTNPKYKEFSYNYRDNLKDKKYNNPDANFTDAQQELYNYLSGLMTQFDLGYRNNRYLQEGYAPRVRRQDATPEWYMQQGLAVLGLQKRSYTDRQFKQNIDFAHDTETRMSMLELIKGKGYKPLLKYGKQGTMSDEDWARHKKEIKEQNKQIAADNLKIDNALLNRNWQEVFGEFVFNATMYEARNSCKDIAYLMIEDLKNRSANSVNNYGKVSLDRNGLNIPTTQSKVLEVFQNYTRRVIYNQYKELSPYAKWADNLQNIASAKYMIGNLLSGAANINTGVINMLGERFAQDYLGAEDYRFGNGIVFANQIIFIKDAYSDRASNKWSAYAKYFDVVELDNKKQLATADNKFNVVKTAEAINDALYFFQSGGEFAMQNSIMFGMLKSHRVYTDIYNGKTVVGSFNDYVQNIDYLALKEVIKDNVVYENILKEIFNSIRKDSQKQKDYSELRRNLIQEFFSMISDRSVRKELINKFTEIRADYVKQAKEEFEQLPTFESQFHFDEEAGCTVINGDALIDSSHVAAFKDKVISVNKKIHGVYDKTGAALIETKWWGSLVMQYHKHLYPGFAKRFRTKGYYNETRQTNEKGSYVSYLQWRFADFKNYKEKLAKRREDNQNENDFVSGIVNCFDSIITALDCYVSSLIDIGLNWKTLSLWEQHNIRRIIGDVSGVLAAFVGSFLIYLGWDDDEIKESKVLSSALYLFDRLLTETIAYNFGMYSELGTLYSSPIAASGLPVDILTFANILRKDMFDENYDYHYDRGIYKGQSRYRVLIDRNIPLIRQWKRLERIGKSNAYYRVGEKNISTRVSKNIARKINPND